MSTTGTGFASALFILAAAAAAQAQSPPVGYWKGDDSSLTTQAFNSATNTNDGTYTGGATTDPSNKPTLLFPNASSMSFNGTSAYVNISSFSWPATGGPVTVAFWNKVTTAQASTAFTIGNQGNPNRFLAHAPWSDGNIYWDYGDQAGTGRISTSYSSKLGQWCHVALVSSGSANTFKAIYLDGVLAVSATTSSGPTSALTGVNIGAWSSSNSYHNGLIDDFRIYNRMLTLTEIQALAAGNTEISAPTNVTAVAGNAQADVSWNAVSGATSYNVKYGTTFGGPYPTVIPVTGTTTTTVTSLTNSTTYYFVVSAVNGLGESLNSFQAVAKPMGPPRTTVVGTNHDSCGCGVSSESSAGLLGALAALAAFLSCGRRARHRTVPKATLR